MYTAPATFMLIENIIIFFVYMIIMKRTPLKENFMNQSSTKKTYWEKVLSDQEIKELPQFDENEHEQESFSTPKNEHIIQQFWFVQKFFLHYTLINYTHVFHIMSFIKKEWKLFTCRNNQIHWTSLLLPLIFYQLAAFISFKIQNIGFFLASIFVFGIMNVVGVFIYNPKYDLDAHMHETCLKIKKLRELFMEQKQPEEEIQENNRDEQNISGLIKNKSNYYPNLSAYNLILQQHSQPKWCITVFVLSLLLSFQISDIHWELTFSWFYGMLLEQLIRVVFCVIYSKRLANKWILQGPDQIYFEMQILAEYYKPFMLVSKSPQKYIMNDTHVNISEISKDQSNQNILNHNSTQDIIKKHQILRITSANLGTTEDTKLEITENVKELPIQDSDHPLDTEQNNNKQNLNQQTEMDTQPEECQFKKKKIQRVKLDALYHSKVTNRSPRPGLPRPQFYSSQKNQYKDDDEEENQEETNVQQVEEIQEQQEQKTIQYDVIQFQDSKREQSPVLLPQFNPIDFLNNISPIGSEISKRNQIPHQWEEPDEEEACNFKSEFNQDFQEGTGGFDKEETPKLAPLHSIINTHHNRSPINQSQISGALSKVGTGSKAGTVYRRNNSQKTSKEEEEKSYKEQKRIKVKSLSRSRKSSPEKKTKLSGKPRGESMKVKRNDIPALYFDSARFKSPYLDVLPGMKDSQQKTHRKQNASGNQQKMQQIIQSFENIQTSNENRNKESID